MIVPNAYVIQAEIRKKARRGSKTEPSWVMVPSFVLTDCKSVDEVRSKTSEVLNPMSDPRIEWRYFQVCCLEVEI